MIQLEERFVPLAIPDYPMWTGGGTVRWYTDPDTDTDAIMRNDADTWLWVRAPTINALDRIRTALPGAWSMTPH